MGYRACICTAHRDQRRARSGQVEWRAVSSRPGPAWALDDRRAGEQRLEFCRRVRQACCEPDASSVLPQLQSEERLVHYDSTHHHCQLEGLKWQCLDGPFWRRHWPDHEGGGAADEPVTPVLWQRCVPNRYFALGYAGAGCVPVPQALQGKREGVAGKEAEGVEPGGAAEEMNCQRAFRRSWSSAVLHACRWHVL